MSKYLENDVVAASLCILHKEYYAVCRKLAREGGCCRCCFIQRRFGQRTVLFLESTEYKLYQKRGCTYLECSDAVAVFLVVEPLALVLESVGSFADAKSGPFVIFPLAHVRLRHAGIQRLVLWDAEPSSWSTTHTPTTTKTGRGSGAAPISEEHESESTECCEIRNCQRGGDPSPSISARLSTALSSYLSIIMSCFISQN